MRKSRGFSFIELMVVSVVIGILLSIAMPNYVRSVERVRCSFAMSTLKSIRNAAILYGRKNQTFATMTLLSLETLAGSPFASGNTRTDWRFLIHTKTANDFSLRANRLKGPHSGKRLELNAEGSFAPSTYHYLDPGGF